MTGVCGTYARYKDIMTGYIPAPNEEPELAIYSPEVAFGHFKDDDLGGASDVDKLFDVLHQWYFPSCLGHHVSKPEEMPLLCVK